MSVKQDKETNPVMNLDQGSLSSVQSIEVLDASYQNQKLLIHLWVSTEEIAQADMQHHAEITKEIKKMRYFQIIYHVNKDLLY